MRDPRGAGERALGKDHYYPGLLPDVPVRGRVHCFCLES
jgi:hypothetical protein